MTDPNPNPYGWIVVGIVWLGYSFVKSAVDSFKEHKEGSAADTRSRILFGIRKLLDFVKERR